MSGARSRISSRDNALLVKVRKLNAAPDAYRKLGIVWLEGDHLLSAALARGWRIDDALVAASHEHDPTLQPLLQRTDHLRTRRVRQLAQLGQVLFRVRHSQRLRRRRHQYDPFPRVRRLEDFLSPVEDPDPSNLIHFAAAR